MNNIIKNLIKHLPVILIFSYQLFAQVNMPSFISDNMVLQQQSKPPIWGWAPSGTKISIYTSWDKQNYQTTADYKDDWFVTLSTPSAGGPYFIVINNDTLSNVMIGEVWLCSGQSNMQWALEESSNPEIEIPKANFPNIRMFYAARDHARKPQKDVYGQWDECTPEIAKTFSAVAYYFGREINQELDVPIGLLHCSWGGSTVQAWTNPEALIDKPEAEFYFQVFDEKIKNTPPGKLPRNYRDIGSNYYGMIHPLIPYGIKGALWYQGENNVFESEKYRNMMEYMIANWRDEWGIGDFPFYYVQLAPYNYSKPLVGAALRDVQRKAMDIKNTGMVVTLDIGNPEDIHPKNKLDVGKRLALWALAKTYDKKDIIYSGPIYKTMKIEENKVRIEFEYIGSGLKCSDDELNCFTIAGRDSVFYEANAVIENNTVIVSSQKVKNPLAVRFAFKNSDVPNLFNNEGLPASTFRTDNWKLKLEKKPNSYYYRL